MIKKGIPAKKLLAEAVRGDDIFTLAKSLNDWLRQLQETNKEAIIHDIILVPGYKWGVLVIYSKRT